MYTIYVYIYIYICGQAIKLVDLVISTPVVDGCLIKIEHTAMQS
jgi:hypothetical protein